ncbi:MAG: amino acid ABC transporter permease [Candidatus Tectomicrobia bacterium]|nr:amino acid ABC transporter permease [Candidatus Tectomicrobia bacterium]
MPPHRGRHGPRRAALRHSGPHRPRGFLSHARLRGDPQEPGIPAGSGVPRPRRLRRGNPCPGGSRLARSPLIRLPAAAYVELFRGVPLVMVIFWMWFVIPQLLRLPIPEYGVALTAFVIFEAAYFGEIVRAGIQSVPRGQVEAAASIGLTKAQAMLWVVLPQALRNMVPSLVTQMIVLFKDTSLASIIGYVDLTKAAQIVNNREIRPFELYLFIAVVYWAFAYSMSRLARRFETRPQGA